MYIKSRQTNQKWSVVDPALTSPLPGFKRLTAFSISLLLNKQWSFFWVTKISPDWKKLSVCAWGVPMRGPSFRPIGEKFKFFWRKKPSSSWAPMEPDIYAYRWEKSANGVGVIHSSTMIVITSTSNRISDITSNLRHNRAAVRYNKSWYFVANMSAISWGSHAPSTKFTEVLLLLRIRLLSLFMTVQKHVENCIISCTLRLFLCQLFIFYSYSDE